MPRYEIGRQIGNRKVITTSGESIGRLYDIEMETNGKFNSLIVIPDANTKANLPKDDKGRFVIPYSMVNAIGQYIIIKE